MPSIKIHESMTKVVRPLSCRSRQSNTNLFQPKTAQLPNCPTAQLPNCPIAQLPNCPIAQLPNCLTVFQPDLGVTHSTFTHSHRSSQRYKPLKSVFHHLHLVYLNSIGFHHLLESRYDKR
jgi:hypothetical protein